MHTCNLTFINEYALFHFAHISQKKRGLSDTAEIPAKNKTIGGGRYAHSILSYGVLITKVLKFYSFHSKQKSLPLRS
jgi:hypothetical protein